MGTSKMSNFAVASNRHCFFCLNQILELKTQQTLSSPLATQTDNSLQYLTRYLRMDLRKVFMDKGQVSPELLAKVEKARLKVELCEECRCLSERFSNVYRQLEKLELELGSTLSLIHGKLASADATDKLHGLTSDLDSNWNGLLEVVDVLRAEAIQKSSRKLSDTPRVRIHHLKMAEVKAKQSMVKPDKESSHMAVSGLELETSSVVKMESPNMDSLADNDDYFPEDTNSNLDSEFKNGNAEMEGDVNAEDNAEEILPEKDIISEVPRTTRNIVGPGKCSINSETGKRKCNDCSKDFNSLRAFTLHYQTTHLKLRYKCISCNKLFSQKSNLRLHQRTSRSCSVTETAPKFKWHLCEKSFSRKDHLKGHLEGVHYKLQKFPCDLCGKKFNTKIELAQHKRKLHKLAKAK